jgi:hypothetical protein
MPRRAARRACGGNVGNRRASSARERVLWRRICNCSIRRNRQRGFNRPHIVRRARVGTRRLLSAGRYYERHDSRATRMESSSRPRRRRRSIAKISRMFLSVYPGLPSDSKDNGWAVAGVIMIVSSANSAAKRSLWGSPIHSSCSIESPRRVPTGGLTSL